MLVFSLKVKKGTIVISWSKKTRSTYLLLLNLLWAAWQKGLLIYLFLFSEEPYLRIATEDENGSLYDEEYSAKGSKIYMIFRNSKLNIDILVPQISGPNHKTNQAHFLDDRFKIARSLKIILNNILHSALFASPVEKRKNQNIRLSNISYVQVQKDIFLCIKN